MYKSIIIHQILKKPTRQPYQRQPLNFTQRALLAQGGRRVLRTISNFYLKLMFFLLFSFIFPLILLQTFIFRNFSKMSIFRIFLLRSTLEWFWTFGARIFVFIPWKLWQGYKKKKNTRIWRIDQYSYSKSWKNRPDAHISVNRQNSPEGRYWRKGKGECFAPFLIFI